MAKTTVDGPSIAFVITGFTDGTSITVVDSHYAEFYPSPDRLCEWLQSTWGKVLYPSDAISPDVNAPEEKPNDFFKGLDPLVDSSDNIL